MSKGKGDWCAVAGCSNYSGETSDLSYFRFPKDEKCKKEWVRKCYRGDKFNANTRNCTICSLHFKDDDFEENMQARLLRTKSKPKLKPNAIPSQNLPRPSTISGIRRQQRMMMKDEIKKQKETISMLLIQSPSEEVSSSDSVETLRAKLEDKEKEIRELREENEKLKYQLEEMEIPRLSDETELLFKNALDDYYAEYHALN